MPADQHHVTHDPDRRFDDRCWASSPTRTDCRQPAESPVGLCADHLADIRNGTHTPREYPPVVPAPAWPTFTTIDETHHFYDMPRAPLRPPPGGTVREWSTADRGGHQ